MNAKKSKGDPARSEVSRENAKRNARAAATNGSNAKRNVKKPNARRCGETAQCERTFNACKRRARIQPNAMISNSGNEKRNAK